MKEIILDIARGIIAKRKADGKFPDGADALEIQRQFHNLVTSTLDELETEGALKSYPTVNGIKVYNFTNKQ